MNETAACVRGTARWLGYLGLVPFVFFALGSHGLFEPMIGGPFSLSVLAFYAMVIPSFMAGLLWAYALLAPGLSERIRMGLFVASVLPPIGGWCVAGFLGARASVVAAALLLSALFLVDLRLKREPWYPGWFFALRLKLTAAAVLSLLIASLAPVGPPAGGGL